MTEKDSRDNRQLKRIWFDQEVEVIGWKKVRSSQLGLGGMFLNAEDPPAVGKELLLRFKLSDQNPEFLAINARVLYVHPGKGFGLEFKNLPWETLEKISEYLEDK